MKKTLFLLFCLVCCAGTSAQDVFPTSGAIWSIHQYPNGERWVYGLSGDTILNELTYQKLYLLNDTTLNIDKEDIYVCGIRQADRKVYVQPADKKNGEVFDEFLMYDFSKKEGETINFGKKPYMIRYEEPTFENVIIDDLFERNGYVVGIERNESITKWYIDDDGFNDEWMEGIGSLSGLFFSPLRTTTCCGGSTGGCVLACMKLNGEVKYLAPECASCFDMPNRVNIEDERVDMLSVSYDPAGNIIKINTRETPLPAFFSLVGSDGRIVYSTKITEDEADIPIKNAVGKGVYIYRIAGDNLNEHGKIIIN